MQSERPTVRPADDADFGKIAAEYPDRVSNPFNPFSDPDRARLLPREGLLVAEFRGAFAGFLYWFLDSDRRSDGSLEQCARIVEIKVNKEFFNKHVGEVLLVNAIKEIERQEIPIMYVQAPEDNYGLCELYQKAGFTTISRTLHMRYLYPADRHRTERPHAEARDLAVFFVELREQCRMFMTAYAEMMEMISIGPPLDDAERQRVFSARVWSRLQAALAASAIISKMLWPNPSPKKDGSDRLVIQRAQELRGILKLRGATPFPLAVRNSFEHIDERLIAWLPEQEEEIPWGWSLSPFKNEEEPKGSDRAFRYFNIVTLELRVASSRCNLKEVMEHVRDIDSRLPEEAHVIFGSEKDRTLKAIEKREQGHSNDS